MLINVHSGIFLLMEEAEALLQIPWVEIEKRTERRFFQYRGFATVFDNDFMPHESYVDGIFEISSHDNPTIFIDQIFSAVADSELIDGHRIIGDEDMCVVLGEASFSASFTCRWNGADCDSKRGILDVRPHGRVEPMPLLLVDELIALNDQFGFVPKFTLQSFLQERFDREPGIVDQFEQTKASGDLYFEASSMSRARTSLDRSSDGEPDSVCIDADRNALARPVSVAQSEVGAKARPESPGSGHAGDGERPIDRRNQRTWARLVAVLCAELKIDTGSPYTGAEQIAALAASHGLVIPQKKDTTAKILKAVAAEIAEQQQKKPDSPL